MYFIKFSCLPYIWSYFVLLLLIFSNILSSSSSVNCSCLISCWPLIIFWISWSVISGWFPSRFLKCPFHIWSFSSWLAAFSFAFEVLFLPITSFTVCHANHNCLSLNEFLILLIWPWMYSNCSFWYVFVLSWLS